MRIKSQKSSNKRKGKVIYIAGRFQNNPKNQQFIENKVKEYLKQYPDYIFVNGVSCFGFLYEYVSYEHGLQQCLWLLEQADEVWVVGNQNRICESVGTLAEIRYAKKLGKPVRFKTYKIQILESE